MSALPDEYTPGPGRLRQSTELGPVEVRLSLESPIPAAIEPIRHLVAAVFSAFMGERRTKNASDVYRLDRALRRLSRLAGRPVNGRARDGALKVLRARGLTRDTLRREWQATQARNGRTATLARDLLEEVFPKPLWEIVAMIILIGPAGSAELVERVLKEVASEEVAPTRARPDGGMVSQSTIESYAEPLKWVMRALNELGAREFPCAELAT
jgi:hypothetical protein